MDSIKEGPAAGQLRRSGSPIVEDMPWGTHFCQFYHGHDDLLDVLTSYFKAGLENNEFCLWITSKPLSAAKIRNAMRASLPDFDRYVKTGQIEIIPHTDWYLKGGSFDMHQVINGWIEKHEHALSSGFDGLRLAGNTFWLQKSDWKDFMSYEEEINRVIGGYRMLALCTYCLKKCSALDIIDVVRHHQFALIKKEGEWELIERSSLKLAKKELAEMKDREMHLRRRLEIILDTLPSGVVIVDKKSGRVIYQNRRALELYGRNLATGHTVAQRIGKIHFYKNDGSRYSADEMPASRALNGEELRDVEIGIERWDGLRVIVSANASPIRDEAGEIVGSVTAFEDITKRKKIEESLERACEESEAMVKKRTAELAKVNKALKAEIRERAKAAEELRTASRYARSLIEASIDPLVTINAGGKIMDVNRATELVTGLSRDELIGSDFSDYFTDPEKAREGYRRVFLEGSVMDYPLAIRHSSGRVTDVLYNATVYRNEAGEVQGIFAAARDVTELKRTRDALQKAHDQLELRVEERTQELLLVNQNLQSEIRERRKTEQLLAEHTRQLEMINKELESFSYSVSHDLRAPLRAIDGYSRMLLRSHGDRFDDEARRKFNIIRESTQRMGQLIDDLLAFSRLGRREMNMKNIDMEALAKSVWQELQALSPDRTFKVSIRSMPQGFGDPALIRQVFANLLSNAVKFTRHKKQAEIDIGGYPEGDSENVYFVKDNGVGFEMQYYDKLFGVFQRLHSLEEFEGTGVGLAIVNRIISRHGGRVWAKAEVGRGAEFYFTLRKEPCHEF
ncbi:MAG: MEDS domain-containing protein [Syntrophales bacterium]